MYRILLADDEGIMLESLKSIIGTYYGQECEIHCAKTGRAVVEEAQSYPPDICFMDIQMPGISGIQAIREIQKFNRSVVFVIITAYDKFNYAKEAVNLGVMEFLTKPVNKKVVLEVCSRAMEKVDETRRRRSDDLRIREKLETVVPMLESGYINNILLQDDFCAYEDNYPQLLDIHETHGYMIVVEFGDATDAGTLENPVGASVKANRFYPVFREIVKGFFDCLVGPIMGNRIVLLVPCESSAEEYEERVATVTRTRNLVHKLESRIDSRFRCGIGRVKELGGGLKGSFQEAMVALRADNGHVVHIEDVPAAQEYDGDYLQELERRYQRQAIVRGKTETTVIQKAKDFIRENFHKDISLDEVSREVDISPYYFSKLFKQETGQNFIEYLTEVRLDCARDLLKGSECSIKEICVRAGYGDPNYFSRIFKKYEGVTPSEFRERLG